MASFFNEEEYDDHFYSSKSDEKKEQKPHEETPEEREEREMKELTYERSTNRKRMLVVGGVALLVLGIVIALWLRYFHPYIVSEERGVILKVRAEGTVLKTYEVQMISEKYITDTIRAFKAGFEFTIKDDSLAAKASRLQSTGRRVTVKYEEFKGMLPWRGESNRFATDIVTDEEVRN
ncbi:MAG: hypothetical protein Q4B68_00815 [Bacteroidales bacterium]|nr:hypothetical protein [Bacteroidales bacterium]